MRIGRSFAGYFQLAMATDPTLLVTFYSAALIERGLIYCTQTTKQWKMETVEASETYASSFLFPYSLESRVFWLVSLSLIVFLFFLSH